ncbi:diguanylate cyclase [Agarivorans sp. Alg241-V36]|uniref:diguanylate cyclase n=1 Tax=Agarivorans sp. Alg241-V36 TaxID=2305992 RepID=UPI0013D8B819|nr:diguanylate cyclase [Agarivorans sp. Alg241-V36]
MTEKILLVDDEPEIREILAELLEDEGYTVVQAENGEAAFESFMSQEVDLVITDVRMPTMTGVELLKAIKQTDSEVDTIILTGQSDELTAIDCLRAGAYDYLLKPVEDLDVMLNSVNRAIEKRSLRIKNLELMDQLEELAVRDPLTGLYNMRPFYQFVDAEISSAQEHSHHLGVLFLDIDYFKKINDNFGHQFGDHLLRWFAELLKAEQTETTNIFRYGGEEFVMVLPETNTEKTIEIGKRLLEVVRQQEFTHDGVSTNITVSIGGAVYPVDSINQTDLIRLADQALYKAKESGRDCFIMTSSESIIK